MWPLQTLMLPLCSLIHRKKILRDSEEWIEHHAKESHDIPEEAGSLGGRNNDVISRDVQALIDGT